MAATVKIFWLILKRLNFLTKCIAIQTIKNDWDVNTTILGTSGDDSISGSLTDDASSDTDYQINPGAGKDLVIGGIEPTDMGWVWGDTVVYDAQSKYFDISIKELSYALNEAKDTVTAMVTGLG